MGDGVGDLDTALGVEEDEVLEPVHMTTTAMQNGSAGASSSVGTVRPASGAAVEMTGGYKEKDYGAAAYGAVGLVSSSKANPWDRCSGNEQQPGGGSGSKLPVSNSARDLTHPDTPAATSPAAARVGDVPVSLPAIRTSLPVPGSNNSTQQQPAVATFSLGDEDELQEIKLRSPTKSPIKRD